MDIILEEILRMKKINLLLYINKMSESKEDIINRIYFNPEIGFGSITDTYKQAVKLDSSITVADVKKELDKLSHRQIKGKTVRGFNSYVPKRANQQIQIDLADFSRAVVDGFRYAVVAVDVFTKYLVAVPIKGKQAPEITSAFEKILNEMGVPEELFSDNEGSFNSTEFIRVLNKNKIKHLISSTSAPFVESAIRAIKNMVFERIKGLKREVKTWVEMLPFAVKKYNNTAHSTIK